MAEIKKYLDFEGLKLYDEKIKALIKEGGKTEDEIKEIVVKELAAQLVPADAKESLNTIAEIAAWIQDHPDDAAQMNLDIDALETAVGKAAVAATETTEAQAATGLFKDVEDLDARLDILEASETDTFTAISTDEISGLFSSI